VTAARASARTYRRGRVPARRPPIAETVALGRDLAAIMSRATARVGATAPRWWALASRGDGPRAHALLEESIRDAAGALAQSRHAAGKHARAIADHGGRELGRQLRAALGIDVAMPQPRHERFASYGAGVDRGMRRALRDLEAGLTRHLAALVDEAHRNDAERADAERADAEFPIEHALHHVNLISGLTKTEREQLAAEIATAHQEGNFSEATMRIILRERFAMMEKRAELVARDQVAKLDGQINADRQIGLGVTHFRWNDKRDDRVRPLHRARHGLVYAWAKPPKTAGVDSIPGSDPLCRCGADPVVDNIAAILNPHDRPRSPRRPGTREAPALAEVSTVASGPFGRKQVARKLPGKK
jgi:SPP1 gp7 family putative phage head morphogenesis protein